MAFKTINEFNPDDSFEGFDFLIMAPSNSDILILDIKHPKYDEISKIFNKGTRKLAENIYFTFEEKLDCDLIMVDNVLDFDDEETDDMNTFNYLVSCMFHRKDVLDYINGLPEVVNMNDLYGFYILRPSDSSAMKKISFFMAKTLSSNIFLGSSELDLEPSSICLDYLNKRFS